MSFHRHCSPSRAESNHKDLIIAQLRDEIRELQHRECEYHEALTRLRELEIKMDTLQEEKANLERKRRDSKEETDFAINETRENFDRTKRLTADRELELSKLQNEKARIEEELDSKRISSSKMLKDMEDLKYSNSRNAMTFSDLRKNCKRKEDENCDQQQRIDGLSNDLVVSSSENTRVESDIQKIDSEVLVLRNDGNEGENEKNYLKREVDDQKLNITDVNRQINSQEGHVAALDRDIRHIRSLNQKYEREIEAESNAYQSQHRKNTELTHDIEHVEVNLKDSTLEVEDTKRELRKTQNLYQQVGDDNRLLEIDIEKYKEAIRALSLQNDELVVELDKITEQDESIRYILNRKTRIDNLIIKAEKQVERNQMSVEIITYSQSPKRKN